MSEGRSLVPPSKIKRLMQADDDVGKLAAGTPVLVARALEIFVSRLLSKAAEITLAGPGKTILPAHIKHCVTTTKEFDFLFEVVKDIPDLEEDRKAKPPSKRRKTQDVSSPTSSSLSLSQLKSPRPTATTPCSSPPQPTTSSHSISASFPPTPSTQMSSLTLPPASSGSASSMIDIGNIIHAPTRDDAPITEVATAAVMGVSIAHLMNGSKSEPDQQHHHHNHHQPQPKSASTTNATTTPATTTTTTSATASSSATPKTNPSSQQQQSNLSSALRPTPTEDSDGLDDEDFQFDSDEN